MRKLNITATSRNPVQTFVDTRVLLDIRSTETMDRERTCRRGLRFVAGVVFRLLFLLVAELLDLPRDGTVD